MHRWGQATPSILCSDLWVSARDPPQAMSGANEEDLQIRSTHYRIERGKESKTNQAEQKATGPRAEKENSLDPEIEVTWSKQVPLQDSQSLTLQLLGNL